VTAVTVMVTLKKVRKVMIGANESNQNRVFTGTWKRSVICGIEWMVRRCQLSGRRWMMSDGEVVLLEGKALNKEEEEEEEEEKEAGAGVAGAPEHGPERKEEGKQCSSTMMILIEEDAKVFVLIARMSIERGR
jgi:hypothetical protein